MAHQRNRISPADIPALRSFLKISGIEFRDGKGKYQRLQVKIPGGWGAICITSKDEISTPTEISSILTHFNLWKTEPTITGPDLDLKEVFARIAPAAPAPAPAPAESDKRYVADLRDDAAIRFMAVLLEGEGLGGSEARIARYAEESYAWADALLKAGGHA